MKMNRSEEKMLQKSGYLAVEQIREDTDEWARRRADNKEKGHKPVRKEKSFLVMSKHDEQCLDVTQNN